MRKKSTPKTAKKSAINRDKKKAVAVRSVGRPKHEPDKTSRAIAQLMAGYGATQEQIALKLEICVETLVKHYPRELEIGAIEANNVVMGSMMKAIRDFEPGFAALIIWWTKARLGWKEGFSIEQTVIKKYEEIRDPQQLAELTARELISLYRAEVAVKAESGERID